MKTDLAAQTETLGKLLKEIEEKKSVASRYAQLATANKDAVAAVRNEMEEALRQELARQSEQGRWPRRIASIILSAVTLFIGAALGAYFKDLVAAVVS